MRVMYVGPILPFLLLLGLGTGVSAQLATPITSVSSVRPANGDVRAEWRIFGPLPLGGVGASALSAIPGSIFKTLAKITKFPSETADGGFATWLNATRNETAGHISALFNRSVPPLTAWAVGSIHVLPAPANPDGTVGSSVSFVAMRCTDPAYVHVQDDSEEGVLHHCPGSRAPCALSLPAGLHKLYVQAFAWGRKVNFDCKIDRKILAPTLLAMPGIIRPAAIVHEGIVRLAGAHAAVVVHNADPLLWATVGTARITSEPRGIVLAADGSYLPRIAPRQTRALRLDLDYEGLTHIGLPLKRMIHVKVNVEYDVGTEKRHANFNFTVPVLGWPTEVYDATYIDVDGSVQAVSLRPPKKPCVNGCSTLLSTHGAGVDALGDAWTGAYATQRGAWVLLPTGRSPYGQNWEGAQMTSALRCLKAVGERMPGVPDTETQRFKVRKDWVLFAGHSMGGHGCLVLSTHFPDLLVASMPIAGWLRYGTYQRAGDAFHAQLPFSDAALRAIFDLSVAEYATDLYSENVLGIPFTARVGSNDRTVPPTNLRKFCRLVREYELYNKLSSSFVTLNEVPGVGHWFGGVMDDDVLQPYFDDALSSSAKPVLPASFSLFTINPATTGSRGGLRILQLHTPFESARIIVRISEDGRGNLWALSTRNVHRFRYRAVNGIHPRPHQLMIDDNAHTILIPEQLYKNRTTDVPAKYLDFCLSSSRTQLKTSRTWASCDGQRFPPANSVVRGPDTSGPLTQVISGRRLSIVYPAGDKMLLGLAVGYANSLHARGIEASITSDSATGDLMQSGLSNLVLLGGANINSAARELQKNGRSAAVRVTPGRICIAQRCTERPGAGIAFLSAGPHRSLAVVIAGTDKSGLESAAVFLPRSTEQKIPEWVLVQSGDGFGWRGYGAVQGAGYWNMNWELDATKTYPAEWAVAPKQRNSDRLPVQILLVLVLIAVAVALVRACVGVWKTGYSVLGDEGQDRPRKADEMDLNESEDQPFLSAALCSESGVQ